jgi:hypothetical protein
MRYVLVSYVCVRACIVCIQLYYISISKQTHTHTHTHTESDMANKFSEQPIHFAVQKGDVAMLEILKVLFFFCFS